MSTTTMVVVLDDADGEVVRVYDDECYAGDDHPIGLPPAPPDTPRSPGLAATPWSVSVTRSP